MTTNRAANSSKSYNAAPASGVWEPPAPFKTTAGG